MQAACFSANRRTAQTLQNEQIHSISGLGFCFEGIGQGTSWLCNKSLTNYSLFYRRDDLTHAIPLMLDVVEAFLLPGMQLFQKLEVFVVGFLELATKCLLLIV